MKISVKLADLPMEIGLQHDEYRFVFAPFASEEPPMAFAAIHRTSWCARPRGIRRAVQPTRK